MSDEPAEAVAAKPPKNTLVVVLLVLNLLTVAGTAAYFIMFGTQSAAAAPAKEAESSTKLGPLLALSPLVANLAGSDVGEPGQFLKLSASMEIKDEASVALVEAAMVPIRDQLLMHLSSLKTSDVEGPAKRTVLQTKMLELTNKAVGTSGLVKRVFFTEFVVQ